MSFVECLTPTCKRAQAWKGLCAVCYTKAKRLVDAGLTTWEKLEKMKLAVAQIDELQQATDPFTKAFHEGNKNAVDQQADQQADSPGTKEHSDSAD